MNRAARLAASDDWLDAARAELGDRYTLDVRFPATAAESAAIARRAGALGRIVIVAGGDGTVSLVADAMAESGGTLGILPLGTGNDLARELAIPHEPRAAARRIRWGSVHPTDLVTVNGRCFTTVGGLGLVSRSTVAVTRLRAGRFRALARLAGAAVYRFAATASLIHRRISGEMKVTWRDPDGALDRTRTLRTHGVFVTNHRTCGGGLVIPSGGRADDGVFELVLIPETSRGRLIVNLGRLSAGLPLAPGVLEVVRADRAVIETENEDTFVADGEELARGRRFELGMRAGALGVLR